MSTKIDLCSEGLKDIARDKQWWDGKSDFDWSQVMGGGTRGSLTSPDRRWLCGRNLLQEKSAGAKFSVEKMMEVLRDQDSGINRPGGDFPTAGSQVSSLGHGSKSSCHWFTASASPSRLHLNG